MKNVNARSQTRAQVARRTPSSCTFARFYPVQREFEFDRVRAAIGARIEQFARERITDGRRQFHAADLREYVSAVHPTAPASADRILRALRQDGRISYAVINRRASLYELAEPNNRTEGRVMFLEILIMFLNAIGIFVELVTK